MSSRDWYGKSEKEHDKCKCKKEHEMPQPHCPPGPPEYICWPYPEMPCVCPPGATGPHGSTGPSGVSGSVEFLQQSLSSNNSVASGQAVEFLADKPAGLYNTIAGLSAAPFPGGQGTEFHLPVGLYMVDYELSSDSPISLALWTSPVSGLESANNDTVAGSLIPGTWIHGRAIISAMASPVYIMLSPISGVLSVAPSGPSRMFTVRLTILKLQ